MMFAREVGFVRTVCLSSLCGNRNFRKWVYLETTRFVSRRPHFLETWFYKTDFHTSCCRGLFLLFAMSSPAGSADRDFGYVDLIGTLCSPSLNAFVLGYLQPKVDIYTHYSQNILL